MQAHFQGKDRSELFWVAHLYCSCSEELKSYCNSEASRPLWNLSWQTHPWGVVRKSCWFPEWNMGKRVRAGCRSVSHQQIGCRCDHGSEWADWKPVEGDEWDTNGTVKQRPGGGRAIPGPGRAWRADKILCQGRCSASPKHRRQPGYPCTQMFCQVLFCLVEQAKKCPHCPRGSVPSQKL